jgi:hypothetical protein
MAVVLVWRGFITPKYGALAAPADTVARQSEIENLLPPFLRLYFRLFNLGSLADGEVTRYLDEA